jgi:hypothetical protein
MMFPAQTQKQWSQYVMHFPTSGTIGPVYCCVNVQRGFTVAFHTHTDCTLIRLALYCSHFSPFLLPLFFNIFQWVSLCHWGFLTKLKIELPYDLVVPLLGIFLKECKLGYNSDTCTPMFIAALFTVSKLWNQRRCSTTGECVKKT